MALVFHSLDLFARLLGSGEREDCLNHGLNRLPGFHRLGGEFGEFSTENRTQSFSHYIVLGSAAFAQVVDITDANRHGVIRWL